MAATKEQYITRNNNTLKQFKSPVDWQILEKIGDGSFGTVYKLRNLKLGHLAAVKVIGALHERTIQDVLLEVDILKRLSNQPNIVQFIGAFKFNSKSDGDQLWVVMEVSQSPSDPK